jgi:hypothetical protein
LNCSAGSLAPLSSDGISNGEQWAPIVSSAVIQIFRHLGVGTLNETGVIHGPPGCLAGKVIKVRCPIEPERLDLFVRPATPQFDCHRAVRKGGLKLANQGDGAG